MAHLCFKLALTILLGSSVSLIFAQDATQYQKLYEDTLVQLQQSQDRKNQLANENALLTEKIAALEAEIRSLRAAADHAELMAMQYSAFRSFLIRYPALKAHFSTYAGPPEVERELEAVPFEFYDRNWPFSAIASEGA